MATKIPCQGIKAMNQYAEGIACPIEMLIPWHFGNSCSTFTAHAPVEANETKRLQNVTFSPNVTFCRPPAAEFWDLRALSVSCLTSTVLPGCLEAQLPQKWGVYTELL